MGLQVKINEIQTLNFGAFGLITNANTKPQHILKQQLQTKISIFFLRISMCVCFFSHNCVCVFFLKFQIVIFVSNHTQVSSLYLQQHIGTENKREEKFIFLKEGPTDITV